METHVSHWVVAAKISGTFNGVRDGLESENGNVWWECCTNSCMAVSWLLNVRLREWIYWKWSAWERQLQAWGGMTEHGMIGLKKNAEKRRSLQKCWSQGVITVVWLLGKNEGGKNYRYKVEGEKEDVVQYREIEAMSRRGLSIQKACMESKGMVLRKHWVTQA